MWDLQESVLIRVLPQTDSGQSVGSFLVDRRARGLSPHTVDLYAWELHYLQAYPKRRRIRSVRMRAPTSPGTT